METAQALIVDLGSQYTLVIARSLREEGYRSAVLSPQQARAWLQRNRPKAILLSGGYDSVTNPGAPRPPASSLAIGAPVLGICYGMQWMAQELGGAIHARRESKEYGKAAITCNQDRLFRYVDRQEVVWASHGDTVERVPRGFRVIARSEGGAVAAMSDVKRKLWGVQFHPEVVQTPHGKKMLRAFMRDICGCAPDWQPHDMIEVIRARTVRQIGSDKAVIGFSGGVDSSTLSAILAPVLGNRLLAVCIDHGALREGEIEEVRTNANAAGILLNVVRAASRFRCAIGHTSHGEAKRRRFSTLYMRILEEEATAFGARFIIQGSLATDFIESGGHGEAAVIKTHHNVCATSRLFDLHPVNQLFKYEIRELARTLGLPASITTRHPFPGPGLYVRVNGAPVTGQRMTIVRWADRVVRDILTAHRLNATFSQLVVSLNCTKRVGIKGDDRVYGYTIEIRAVRTADYMTAVGHQFPPRTRRDVDAAVTKHPRIVAVAWIETHKPPCTIEPE